MSVMTGLSAFQSKALSAKAHSFDQNVISGGAVHFGDTYYLTTEQELQKSSIARQAQPRDSYHRSSTSNDLDHLYIVPRCSTAHFTGRTAQLQQIRQYLTVSSNKEAELRHRIVVLRGLGGSGKSQVCLRYAEIHQESYWGIFWIDASSRSSAEAGFAYLGQQAGYGPTWTSGKYWLSQCSRAWLLVLDNADDLQMDISELFPSGKSGHIIITTRVHDLSIYATAGHVEFGRMEPEEAIELLLKSAYAGAPDSYDKTHTVTARNIADVLGYLAIALNQAGATIRRKIYTIEEYLHLYLGDRDRVFNSRDIPPEEINVITTWEIPFKRIEEQRSINYQDAVVLVCIFAFLHFDSIPEVLFSDIWLRQEQQQPAWFKELPDLLKTGSKPRLRRAITVLVEYSIITVDPNNGTCSMHPVVHQWTKSRIDNNDKMVVWLKCTLGLLSCCDPENFTAARGLSILPHINHCLELTNKHAPSLLETHQGIDQLERFALMFEANGAWKKALPILKKVLEFRMKRQHWWHKDTLKTQQSLARTLWNLFEVKAALEVQNQIRCALWYLRPSPKDWVRFLKPDHIAYCLALDDLTQTLWLAGLVKISIITGRRSVEGLSKRLGDNDPRTWNAMFNLGRTYRHVGDLDSGHKLISFVVRKRKQYLGKDHIDTLMARSELGMSFWARGKQLAIAEKLMTSVRDARTRILGRDHAYTLWSINDLSKILCARGRPHEAVQALENIVPIVEQTLGHNHVGMHMTKGNLGYAYALCKDWVMAEKMSLEMLEVIDEDHRDWFNFMYGHVRIESELGNFRKAKDTCDKMLQYINPKTVSSPRFKSTVELLASVYLRAGQKDELSSLQQEYPWINEANVRKPPPPEGLAPST